MKCHVSSCGPGLVLNAPPCRPGPRAGAQGPPGPVFARGSGPGFPLRSTDRGPGQASGATGDRVLECHEMSCFVMRPRTRTERTTVSPRPPSRGPGPPGPVFARGAGSGCPLRFIRRDKGGGAGMSCYVMKRHDSARRPSVRSALLPHFAKTDRFVYRVFLHPGVPDGPIDHGPVAATRRPHYRNIK